MAHVVRALTLMDEARRELVQAHHGLEVLGHALKLRTKGNAYKPNSAELEAEPASASAV